jgi:hypothetical protein
VAPPPKKKTGLIVGLGVVGALAVGGGIYAATSGGDDSPQSADTEVEVTDTEVAATEPPVVDTTLAPTTTFAPITLPPATVPPETTIADTSLIDLGDGVSFTAPDGYTAERGSNGEYNLTNGPSNLFVQVLTRDPGEDVTVLLQEYVDSFDTAFDAVSYSQLVPYSDASTTPINDGVLLYYQALNADGTGFNGLIDVNRRADGLVAFADQFVDITDTTDAAFPSDVYDEIFASFYAAPSLGGEVELTTPVTARVNTVHTPYIVDGIVAVTPPPGWNVENPGPGRVVFTSGDGQRWSSGRLADTTDLAAAKEAAKAELLAALPDAQFDEPQDITSGDYASSDIGWTATGPAGRQLIGVISVWAHPTNGDAWVSLYTFRENAAVDDVTTEFDFLLNTFDASVVQPR